MKASDYSSPLPEPSDQDCLDLEYYKCATDFWYWFDNFAYLRDERTKTIHGPGLTLWGAQREYIEHLLSGEWVITGKARQLGASWLATITEVWELMFHANSAQVIIAQDDDWAMFHLDRARWVYEQQPEHLRRAVPVVGKNSKHELGLSNGSRIKAMPCTDKAARGISARRVRCEEFAFWENPQSVWTGLVGAVSDGGGQLVIISTANGEGNKYHELWIEAEAGGNKFKAVFFPWFMHPSRDSAWEQEQRQLLQSLFKQEFPATADEMFISSGSKYFEIERLVLFGADGKQLEAGQTNDPLSGYPQGWNVYASPVAGKRYAIGIDTADGGADACSADIVDIESGLQVAQLHSAHWGFDRFADEVYDAAQLYNEAFLVPEQNNHGHALILQLSTHRGYSRIYRYEDYDVVKRAGVQRLGWNNTSKTRPEVLGKLKLAIRDLAIKPMHQPTITEMRAFEYNSSMRAEAKAGTHDDRVFSLALANMGREHELAHVDDNFVMVL